MSRVRVGIAVFALAAGFGSSGLGAAAQELALYDDAGTFVGSVVDGDADDGFTRVLVDDSGGAAVFFTSEDCSGIGYVWNPEGSSRAQGQVVGTNKLVFIPNRSSPLVEVAYQSRLAPGGCVVQSGSDRLVRAIRKGSLRAFTKPFDVQGLH